MTVLGLGHDVVDVAAFAEQLDEPGTRMRALFSARELRQAALRGRAKGDGEAVHLAARWAGKEAVLKAWCEALSGVASGAPFPYTLDDFPWARVEILDDAHGVPHVALAVDVGERLADSLAHVDASVARDAREACDRDAARLAWHVSLSHDGPVASAVVLLERR